MWIEINDETGRQRLINLDLVCHIDLNWKHAGGFTGVAFYFNHATEDCIGAFETECIICYGEQADYLKRNLPQMLKAFDWNKPAGLSGCIPVQKFNYEVNTNAN